MSYMMRGIFWSGAYLVLVLLPLFILIVGPVPAGSGVLWDLSAACGFVGAAMMATMFLLTARLKLVTAPFGIDIIYYFHRLISMVAFAFIIVHPLLLLVADPRLLYFIRPQASPYHLRAGIAALVCMLLLMLSSLWRQKLGIHYERWRFWHVFLSILAMVMTLIHIEGVGHYVNSPGAALLWRGITLTCILVVVYVRLVKPLWLMKHPYRIVDVQREAGNAWTLSLRPQHHSAVSFMPGQFAWLTLWSSPFAMKEHPFSISSSAETDTIRFTIKELGDFTRSIGQCRPGQVAFVDAPYGAFSIDRLPSAGYVFIAGGVGIAPIMSMLRTMADRRDQRPVLLFYAYNTWEEMTFREELQALREKLSLEVVFVLKKPPPEWTGETGLIREELLSTYVTDSCRRFEFLICGPVPMIEAAERSLYRIGIPMRQIHSELFDLV
ncbi:MAG: oxidoreductase [Desulfuromonas sp.]|nr:MAG: oxidoreductase [Desulfuromonas sp.]